MPIRSKNKKAEVQNPVPVRRSFLNWLWFGLIAVALAETIHVVFSFLQPHRLGSRAGEFGTVIEAGPVSSFELASMTAFPRGHFYLCRLEDGGFMAISRKCTHLGCTVPWDEEAKQFVCPCHASIFDRTGDVVRSPAPRALDIFPIRIENAVVYVDTGRPMRRGRFHKQQVVYPNAPV